MRFFSIIFLLFPVIVIAQTKLKPSEKDSINTLSEVIVTATKQKTTLLNIPYSVNVVTNELLQQFQFRTSPESLFGSTGIFIQKTNHGGGSPFIRGLTGNQNLLLIDGIRLNNSTTRFGPNQYFNTIDVFNIDKIEAIRGSGSVQYGSDAMGGVLQVFTKELPFSNNKILSGSIQARAVSQDMEYSGRAEMAYQTAKWVISGGLTKRNFGDLVGGDTTGRQSPSGYTEQDIDLKLKWKVNNLLEVTAFHQQVLQENVPLYHRVKIEKFNYYFFSPQQRKLSYVKFDLNGHSPLLNKISFTTSLQNSLEERTYQRNLTSNRFFEKDKVTNWGLTVDISSEFNTNWTANSGVEYYFDKVNSARTQTTPSNTNIFQRGLYPDNATSKNFSLYTLHHLKFNQFIIETGLRYNAIAMNIKDTAGSSFQLGEVTIKPSSLVGNFSLLYKLTKQYSVYGSFSTGYRVPNVDDMGTLGLVDFRYEIPAYNLKPEKSYNTEIGIRIQTKKVKSSIAYFYMHLQDLINRKQLPGQQINGFNVFIKENNQESFLHGFEYDIDWQISKRFNFFTNLAYAYGQNTTMNEPMRRIPPVNGRMLLTYQKNAFQFRIEYLSAASQTRLAQGDKSDNRIPTGGTPGWNIVNSYAGFSFKKNAVQLAFCNLFNTDYRTHGSGINGAGRNLSISFKAGF